MTTEYQIIYSDGSIKMFPKGYYWRLHHREINSDYFGSRHGPFETKEEAIKDWEKNIIPNNVYLSNLAR